MKNELAAAGNRRCFQYGQTANKSQQAMTAQVIQFPPRAAFVVYVVNDADGWLVLTPRGHGWLHSDQREAVEDATTIGAGFGIPVEVRS